MLAEVCVQWNSEEYPDQIDCGQTVINMIKPARMWPECYDRIYVSPYTNYLGTWPQAKW